MALTNPGNTVRLHSRNAGRASVYEANMWAQKFTNGLYSGNGVLQNTPSANMGVKVGGSTASPDVVIASNPSGFKVALDLVSQQTLTLVAPASNSRIASIVAYTDDLSLNSADTTTTGNQSSCGLIVVYGSTSATPTAPSDSSIRAAITTDGATGSQACYAIIDNITLVSTTTTVTQTMIDAGKFVAQTSGVNIVDNSLGASKMDFTTGIWGQELGRTTLGSSSASITVTAPVTRKYLFLIVRLAATGGTIGASLTANNDTGSNYAYRVSRNGAADGVQGSFGSITAISSPEASTLLLNCFITNIANLEKQIQIYATTSGAVGAANTPNRNELIAKWANTSVQASSFTITNNGTGLFAAGSEAILVGHD